jgi:3-oxoacyl-[acyl-carrier-protein] synthase II
MSARTVWVTGIGAVSPGGWTARDTWNAVVDGKSLGRPIERFDLCGAATRVAATVPGRERSLPDDQSLALEFGLVAAREAVAMAGLVEGDVQMALIGNHGDRRVPVGDRDAQIIRIDRLSEAIAREVGARRWTASHGACAAGSLAIGFGGEYVRSGAYDVVLAGAADSLLNGYDFFQFCNLHGMTERECAPEEASCPFDRRRDGYLLSEGAGFFVLESEEHARARGAEPLAVLEGFGASQNAHHYVALPPDASGPTLSMKAALRSAGLDAADVGYVNAHGTSTPDNDWCETLAIHNALGDHAERVAVSSSKSVLGHATAAAGAVEAVVCVEALRSGVLPPTANLHEPDPRCDLDYIPLEAREQQVDHVVSNSFGFGGHCASIVLGRVA